jgi:sugar (pentulose or hexulose) kinase
MGTECESPVINELSYKYNFTNEGGVGGSIRLLKNIMGMWLIQQCRKSWAAQGNPLSYDEIDRLVEESPAFASVVDPDLEDFIAPGDMPARIKAVCARTGQRVPQTVGEVARCVYESLALKYRQVLEQLESLTGKTYKNIYIVGGGTKSIMLNRMTADAAGVIVTAGPSEATVLGNAAVQLMASGELNGLSQAREIISASFEKRVFEPSGNKARWDIAYDIFINTIWEEAK